MAGGYGVSESNEVLGCEEPYPLGGGSPPSQQHAFGEEPYPFGEEDLGDAVLLWSAGPVLRPPQIGIAPGSFAQAEQPGGVGSVGVARGNGHSEEMCWGIKYRCKR